MRGGWVLPGQNMNPVKSSPTAKIETYTENGVGVFISNE